jgi:hypothetical protein
LLSAFIDGDLDPAEGRSLASELGHDPELRVALEGMREVKSALAALGEARAPRSFALAAPPVPAPSRLGRWELGARVGAVVAAVAFVAVVGSDLRGGTSEPGATEELASSAQNYDSDLAQRNAESANDSAAGAAESSAAAPSSVAGVIPTSLSEPARGSGAAAPALPLTDGTPTALLAPQIDRPAPAATPSERSAAGGPVPADRPVSAPEPSDAPAIDPVAPAQPPAAFPGSLGGAPVAQGDADAVSVPYFPTPQQESLSREWSVSVERSSDLDPMLAAELGLGSLAAVLGAGAGWLWYQRRRSLGAG